MNKQRPILLLVILALVAAAPFSNAQAQQFSEEELSRFLRQHPGADADGDGKLTAEEIKAARAHKEQAEAAKRFIRGELPGVEGLYKVIGGKENSIWADQRGHLGPGFDRLEGYVFYATLYGKSPELISAPIKFNRNPSFLSADLDEIFREIAWKAVVEHPLSGVTDKNENGIGDHLE